MKPVNANGRPGQPGLVWYVSYGSNMNAARFGCYLAGGTPDGAKRGFPGCRNPQPPSATRGCHLPGGIYFATESPVWGGGRAFHDPALPGTTPARAYLITAGQFADVAAQEMYREPDGDLDLSGVLATGRVQLGPGRYETLLCGGELDGHPMLTFTASWSSTDVELVAPSAGYLRMLATGLCDAHGWDITRAARYLAELPGALGTWTPQSIAAILGSPQAESE
ncbi:histone deacetylase [Amycolatopsis cynarae]|uniref:Histone deacetylase n=1 Tax=Amycolatopsis cynarae TaxID=2995223 RepID=A0ABY7B9P1_9PSEU|nr:histone deacetylase [Amycolatopsis sp. HUAS 11-8]WAL68654.1 histone deacetylase [Amycolatopsis sp. HUAS 11-8]